MIERSTMFSSDSRVCSSIIDAILIALLSTVESNWKSIAHTTFGESASIGAIEDTPARLRRLCTRRDRVQVSLELNAWRGRRVEIAATTPHSG